MTTLRKSLTSWVVFTIAGILLGTAGVAMGDDPILPIFVNIDPGESKEKNVGCGFPLIEINGTILEINLSSSKGPIKKSERVECNPDNEWRKFKVGGVEFQSKWRCEKLPEDEQLPGNPDWRVDPHESFWVIIRAKVDAAAGGKGTDPWRYMSVSDVDLDGDTDNNSATAHRPPSEIDSEDLKEYPTGLSDDTIGMIVPLNDDNDVSWATRDCKKSMDRTVDDDIMDMKLKIGAKRDGAFCMYNETSYFYRYDDAGVEDGDPGFNKRVTAGDFWKWIHVEPTLSMDTGAVGHVNAFFTPDAPKGSDESRDKVRFLLVGVDIDVNSDNSGGANPIEATNDYNSGEDFYENHPASELTYHPEFKNGMLVAVNDDSDDTDADVDNGWNGTYWSGPESQIVVSGEDDLRPLVLRAIKLGANDTDARRKGMNALNPRVFIKQIGGTGKLRVFTTGASPQVAWDNTSIGIQYKMPDDTTLWDALKGNSDVNLQVEGLKSGEVILEVCLQLQGDTGPEIHRDRIRITVCGIDLDVNSDGDADDPVDGIYGYLPGQEGTTAKITYNTAGASVVYTAAQQMNLVVTGGPNITSVEVRITASSDDPGFCMNSSDAPNTDDDDYSFSATAEDRGPKAVTATSGKALQAFYCKDFGGYCTVQAIFKTGTTEVLTIQRRVPRDGNINHVADAYSGDIGPGASNAGTDDNDNNPAPGRIAGDGLTRYQEYRGFIVNTAHTRTNPTTKNLFIYDEDSMGLGNFGTVGLVTHLIRNNEWSGTGAGADMRVINMRQDTDRLTPDLNQHGLHLRDVDLGPAWYWGQATGANEGPPRESPEIRVDLSQIRADMASENPTGSPDDRANEEIAHIIAHELGHGIYVTHHAPDNGGEANCIMRYTFNQIFQFGQRGANDPVGWAAMTIPTGMCNAAPDTCRAEVQVSDAP